MKKNILYAGIIAALALAIIFSTSVSATSVIDAPHNETNLIACGDCHKYSLWWQFSPVDAAPSVWIEKANILCLSCHGEDGSEITVLNHSSASLGALHRTELGDFPNACVNCHDPHFQAQLNWHQDVPNSELYLASGNLLPGTLQTSGEGTKASPYISTFQYDTESLTVNASGWEHATTAWDKKTGEADRGLMLSLTLSSPENTYEITGVNETETKITVHGKIDPALNSSGASFGLIYGQLIRDSIQVDSNAKEVKFFNNKGGFANTQNYDGICQICHTKTRNFRNSTGVNFDDYIYDHSGKEDQNCITCHAHTKGMAHGGSGIGCNTASGCHQDQGSHPAHVGESGYLQADCSRCHDTQNFPSFIKDKATLCAECHDDGTGTPTTVPEWGTTVEQCTECHVTQPSTGSHTKHLANSGIECDDCHDNTVKGSTPPNQHLDSNIDVFETTSGDLGYIENKEKGSDYSTCSTAPCHDNGRGTTVVTPTWGSTAPACTACHEAAPSTGSHTKHLAHNGIECNDCHDNTVKSSTPPTQHLDDNIDVFNTSSGDLGYIENKEKGSDFSTCSSASCHDDGQGNAVTSPTWGATVAGCTACHAAIPTTGSHQKHVVTTAYKKAVCANCHDNAVQGSVPPTQHVDGDLDIFDTNPGDLGYLEDVVKGGAPYDSCSSAYCHSSGQSLNGASATPVYATPTWGSTVICGDCHKTTEGTTLGAIDSGSHEKHIASISVSLVNGCGDCHTGAANSGTSYISTNHVDGQISVASNLNYTKAGTPGNGYGSCSSVSCHGAGDPTWGTAVSCETCHFSSVDTDDFIFDNGIMATINSSQWSYSGHGKTDGTYYESGNDAADLPNAANGGSPCAYCHNSSINHGLSSNPFRLANYNALENGWNDNCLICHASVTEDNGYDPDGTGPMAEKTATVKIDKYHYGASHGVDNDGGSLCWDCHDPHGDRTSDNGNIFMVHSKVTMEKSDEYGTPSATVSPIFTANINGSDYANTSDYDGICNVCHTSTSYYRNGIGGADHFSDYLDLGPHYKCIRCHAHGKESVDQYAFNHGGGGDVKDCQECHGHDPGYDGKTGGAGTYVVHSTHTETDEHDVRGPNLGCETCHDTEKMPRLKNLDGSVNHRLFDTDICNNCHSSGGTYNGVNSINGSVGAKDNWSTGVYNLDGTLQEGKEKWCAGCHDESNSTSNVNGTGVTAPNVVGDEGDQSYLYGTGWGYYKSGHGLPSAETFPASGGITGGAEKLCSDCHDQTTSHLDNNARTFDSEATNPDASYQTGYRLKGVDGNYPMHIPSDDGADSYRLCFSCHTNTDAWMTTDRNDTNFFGSVKGNLHNHHMNVISSTSSGINPDYDWDGGYTTGRPTCTTCHNVHGSSNPAMVRDGSLNGKPGFVFRYGNNCDDNFETSPVTLAESDIFATKKASFQGSYCANTCHGNNENPLFIAISRELEPWTVPNGAPELNWVGDSDYDSDGVRPDAAASGTEFTFKVEYSDMNQDAPNENGVQLWIDRDNDGEYENDANPPEKITMDLAFAELNHCTAYSKGADFITYVTLDKNDLLSGNTVKYTFRVTAENGDPAIGPATNDSTLTILNDPPTLEWTGDANYENDGVNPDYGAQDGTFTFKVKYIDDDDGFNCPTSGTSDIQVWIDENWNGSYDEGERYNLTEVSDADTDCTTSGDGKLYSTDRSLANNTGSEVVYDYRFHAFDGTNVATGAPASPGGTVTVAGSEGNNPPFLAWESGTCRPEGAYPPRSALTSSIDFMVRYYDEDDPCPTSGSDDIQVWVDWDGADGYEEDEKFNLIEVDSDTDCTIAGGGKLYKLDDQMGATIANNDLTYEFHATDGIDEALGDPRTMGGTVDVLSVNYIVKKDGNEPGGYTSISAAINASVIEGDKILVYEGTSADPYNESINLYKYALDGKRRELYSACGAEETIISHTNDPVVNFHYSGTSVLDGFTVTGSNNRGIYALGGHNNGTHSEPLIKDCIIRDNNGRGIGAMYANVTITGSEIYNNRGGGVLSYSTVITDSIIRNNTVTGNGGGIASVNPGGTFSLNNVVITDNTASGNGGGISCTPSYTFSPTFEKVTLSGNQSTGGSGGGGYFYQCGPTFINSLVSDNTAVNGGGVALSSSATAKFKNSTIVHNTASPGDGGAFHHSGMGNSIGFANSILWANRADGQGHIGRFTHATGSVVTSDLYDSIIENNGDINIIDDNYFSLANPDYVYVIDNGTNYDSDPNFVNPHANGDYRINAPSDAIDNAGNTSGWGIPEDDIEGNSRPDGKQDIGAYENDASDVTVSFTSSYQTTAAESGEVTITLELSDVSNQNVTVPFTINGSSTATGGGTDFTIPASPVVIMTGETNAEITVTIETDNLDEDSETIIVDLSTPINAFLGTRTRHTISITDDDEAPTVSFVAEGQTTTEDESGNVTIIAELSTLTSKEVLVPFTVRGASTAKGTEYTITASPLSIMAGDTTATITVTVENDNLDENNETIIVDMSSPTNATQGTFTTHTVTTTDNDEPPTVSFTDSEQATADGRQPGHDNGPAFCNKRS